MQTPDKPSFAKTMIGAALVGAAMGIGLLILTPFFVAVGDTLPHVIFNQ